MLFTLSYLGASLCVWWLSGFVPWFLLPDFPFLAIVFSGLFVPGIAGFLCALPPALFREITMSAPSWSMLLGSMALYFGSREIGRRFLLRNEFHLSDGKLAAKVTSLGGWLDLARRKLALPPEALLESMRRLERTADFVVLPSSVREDKS